MRVSCRVARASGVRAAGTELVAVEAAQAVTLSSFPFRTISLLQRVRSWISRALRGRVAEGAPHCLDEVRLQR